MSERKPSELIRLAGAYNRAVPSLEVSLLLVITNRGSGERSVYQVHNPSITPFLPPAAKASGTAVIVIPGGGSKYFPCAWVCIQMLRELGCTLPIELWHLGSGEISPTMQRWLQPLGVQCVDAFEVRRKNPTRHLDELSIFGQNTVAEFSQGAGSSLSFTLKLDEFPLQPARLSDLAGGDPTANAEIVVKLLRGEERGPKRDAVLLNSAAALLVADRVSSITDGWQLAAEVIDSGQAEEKLAELKTGM